MKGIEIIRSVKMFGIRDGISFWFDWSIKSPIQTFIWLNITHKSWCPYSGWSCSDKKCNEKHLTTKAEILKHWDKMHKEMGEVEVGKDGMCIYCGDEKGTVEIPNPNGNKVNKWLVCEDCKKVIKNQHLVGLGALMGGSYGDKVSGKAMNELDAIAKRTGKPIMVAQIRKTKDGYEPTSVVFTGEKENETKS